MSGNRRISVDCARGARIARPEFSPLLSCSCRRYLSEQTQIFLLRSQPPTRSHTRWPFLISGTHSKTCSTVIALISIATRPVRQPSQLSPLRLSSHTSSSFPKQVTSDMPDTYYVLHDDPSDDVVFRSKEGIKFRASSDKLSSFRYAHLLDSIAWWRHMLIRS